MWLHDYIRRSKAKTNIFGKISSLSRFFEAASLELFLLDNHNAQDNNGSTPIHWAACNGDSEMIKILVPLTNNPNAPNNDGETPIHRAVFKEHTEIIKILAPLTDNPNAPNNNGETPSSVAKNPYIHRFLKSFKTSV